ncbi:cache domain-containing sensor histidine kinase [Paenibacillus sp. UNC451MF]|uniref:cache domain-containing sensor histidine kinase n=1 Tax=Paenibacillus sp. UNC451MF TaxID=1449063 RepID=UPI00048B980B|nr:sensor histidine kinase [Paenibacillus sp. UNC451MF]
MKRFMHYFLNLRLKQKLLFTYIVLAIIPILALGIYSYHQSNQFLQRQAMQGMKDTAGVLADKFNYKIGKYNNLTNLIVFNSGIQRIFANQYEDLDNLAYDLRHDLDPFFKMILSIDKEISQLTVYSQNDLPEYGDYIQSADRVKDTLWYKSSNNNTNSTGWYYEQGDLLLTRKFPNFFTNGKYVLLTMKFRYTDIFQDINPPDLGEYGIVITDSNSRVIYSKTTDSGAQLNLEKAGAAGVPEGIASLNGIDHFVIKSMMEQPNWTLYFYAPVAQMSPGLIQIVGATIVIIMLCLFVLMILMGLFSNTLLKQILILNRTMKSVGDGNWDIVIPKGTKDEIGELAVRFSDMLRKIKELINEVYHNRLLQKEAELKVLQTQINPHFLYNSLSIINWKALHLGATDISHIVTTLSKFYRTALNKGESVTSVRSELENMIAYLEIQLIMHDNSFDVEYRIDESLYRCHTLNFILQPIVENAIEHGIDQKLEGRGRLTVTGVLKEDAIEFTVEDNGPGMNRELIDSLFGSMAKGYGLKNVHDRIRLSFGERYGVTAESVEGEGTRMRILLPQEDKSIKL